MLSIMLNAFILSHCQSSGDSLSKEQWQNLQVKYFLSSQTHYLALMVTGRRTRVVQHHGEIQYSPNPQFPPFDTPDLHESIKFQKFLSMPSCIIFHMVVAMALK